MTLEDGKDENGERHKEAGALRGPILLSNTGSVASQKLDDSDRKRMRKCACRRRAKGSTATKEDWFPLQFNLNDDFRKIRRYLQTAKKGLSRTYECQTPRLFEKEFPLLEACRKIFVPCDRQHNGWRAVCNRRFDLREERAKG